LYHFAKAVSDIAGGDGPRVLISSHIILAVAGEGGGLGFLISDGDQPLQAVVGVFPHTFASAQREERDSGGVVGLLCGQCQISNILILFIIPLYENNA
jgi:hypothetical protein